MRSVHGARFRGIPPSRFIHRPFLNPERHGLPRSSISALRSGTDLRSVAAAQPRTATRPTSFRGYLNKEISIVSWACPPRVERAADQPFATGLHGHANLNFRLMHSPQDIHRLECEISMKRNGLEWRNRRSVQDPRAGQMRITDHCCKTAIAAPPSRCLLDPARGRAAATSHRPTITKRASRNGPRPGVGNDTD